MEGQLAQCAERLQRLRYLIGGVHQPIGYPIQSSVTRVRRSRGGGAFLAAEGDQAIRLLRTLRP